MIHIPELLVTLLYLVLSKTRWRNWSPWFCQLVLPVKVIGVNLAVRNMLPLVDYDES